MSLGFQTLAYLLAGAFFILSIGGLSQQETARRGNLAGMIGMGAAILATMMHPAAGAPGWVLLAMAIGGTAGLTLAKRTPMTGMPQMVGLLNAFVGLAAWVVGLSTFLAPGEVAEGGAAVVHALEIYANVTLGALTFTGSMVAWAKLDGKLSGRPVLLPNRHLINGVLALSILVLSIPTATLTSAWGGFVFLVIASLVAAVLGVLLVLAIGGADMPVVISLLNSYSGWTAAAAGFMLSNDLLIITGALVGSSGAILTWIMCEAMNRSIWNVAFGGLGADAGPAPDADATPAGEATPLEADGVAELLAGAKDVLIVPGYGLAVARAQNAVHDLVTELQSRGARVRFAIHPVAGRMPGHMNVLLAEAGVSYDIVHEMEDVADDVPGCDVSLVIGANDIVNPAAEDTPGSPIYGMPVLRVWTSGTCVVFKRSLGAGYAGVANPLFFRDNTRMCFGDARDSLTDVVAALRR